MKTNIKERIILAAQTNGSFKTPFIHEILRFLLEIDERIIVAVNYYNYKGKIGKEIKISTTEEYTDEPQRGKDYIFKDGDGGRFYEVLFSHLTIRAKHSPTPNYELCKKVVELLNKLQKY